MRRSGPRTLDPHQTSKVSATTLVTYRRAVGRLVVWLQQCAFIPTDEYELDDAIVEWKNETLPSKANFELVVAAAEFVWPRAKGSLKVSRAIITGWAASYTPKHTTPVSRALNRLIGLHMCTRRHHRLAIGADVQHHLGLRPNEMLALRACDVLLPEEQANATRGIAVVSLGTLVKTKAKRQQYALVTDPSCIALLRYLKGISGSEARLFPVSYSTYRKVLRDVVRLDLKLSIDVTPHSPRAGFATEAIADGIPFAEVREAGRWKAESSLRGYVDIARSASVAIELRTKHLGPSLQYAQAEFLSFFGNARALQRPSDGRGRHASEGNLQGGRRLLAEMGPEQRPAPRRVSNADGEESEHSDSASAGSIQPHRRVSFAADELVDPSAVREGGGKGHGRGRDRRGQGRWRPRGTPQR